MRVLGIDSAIWAASAGIVDDGELIAQHWQQGAADHAQSILVLVEQALTSARLTLAEIAEAQEVFLAKKFTGKLVLIPPA